MLLLLLTELTCIIMLVSHVKALTFCGTTENQVGLTIINTDSYGVEMDLETLLQSSFPNPGDKDKIRQLFIEDVQNNVLGVNSHYVGVEILLQ